MGRKFFICGRFCGIIGADMLIFVIRAHLWYFGSEMSITVVCVHFCDIFGSEMLIAVICVHFPDP